MVQQMEIYDQGRKIMVQQMEIRDQGHGLMVSVPRLRPRNRNNLSTGCRSECLLLYTTDA